MTTATRTEQPKLLERVEQIRPVIEAHADAADEQRHLSDEVVEALKGAGMFQVWLPSSVGGSETELPDALRLFEAIGRVDGSAGWIVSIAATAMLNFASLDDEVFRSEFGGSEVGIGAVAAFPFQPASKVDGGYRISGRWQFASGCHHATRLAVGGVLMDDGEPVMTEAGGPEVRLLSFPRSAAEILDTWDVAGLRGTGSADLVVSDLFVPEREAVRMLSGERNASCQGALYRVPPIAVGALQMAAVGLGVAQHAVDAFVELAATKKPVLTETPLAGRGTTQAAFGAAVAGLESARSWLHSIAEDMWGLTAWSEAVPEPLRINAQLAGAHATRTAVSVVEAMQQLSGSAGIYATSPIERCFRDIHTLKQNAGVNLQNLEYGGATLLGHPELNRLAAL